MIARPGIRGIRAAAPATDNVERLGLGDGP